MKVKFNRVRLIKALQKSKADALELFKKETRQYHEQLEKAREKHIANVEKYLGEIRNGSKAEERNYHLNDTLNKGVNWPTKSHPPRLEHVEALIQQLELSDDELVVCDTKEEYIQLTRACAILGTCRA